MVVRRGVEQLQQCTCQPALRRVGSNRPDSIWVSQRTSAAAANGKRISGPHHHRSEQGRPMPWQHHGEKASQAQRTEQRAVELRIRGVSQLAGDAAACSPRLSNRTVNCASGSAPKPTHSATHHQDTTRAVASPGRSTIHRTSASVTGGAPVEVSTSTATRSHPLANSQPACGRAQAWQPWAISTANYMAKFRV
jgi:hypothetical protein